MFIPEFVSKSDRTAVSAYLKELQLDVTLPDKEAWVLYFGDNSNRSVELNKFIKSLSNQTVAMDMAPDFPERLWSNVASANP